MNEWKKSLLIKKWINESSYVWKILDFYSVFWNLCVHDTNIEVLRPQWTEFVSVKSKVINHKKIVFKKVFTGRKILIKK